MSKLPRLHVAAWGLCMALMLTGRATAEGEPGDSPKPYYTQDPIGDAFVGIFDNTVPEQIYYWPPLLVVVPIDINLDGRLDLLVSANYYRNGRQGEISQVFIREDQGYRDLRRPIAPGKSHSIIDFTYDTARVRPNPESRSISFFDLNTGGGGFCTLYETRISGASVEFRNIAYLHAQDEEDRARIQSLRHLLEPLEPQVRYMNFGFLQERYAARLHRKSMELERRASRRNSVSLDHRDPAIADRFLDNTEAAYALLDGTANDTMPDNVDQVPEFENIESALEYYMKHNAPNWEPAPADALLQQFSEGALIAALELRVARSDRQERFFALNSLTEVVRRSTDTVARQRFVEQILTGELGKEDLLSERDWLLSFAEPDLNASSRAFLLQALLQMEEGDDPFGFDGRTVRRAGIANLRESLPQLRAINLTQRKLDQRTNNPLFMRSALIAMGRMGDPEAVQEMIECIERVQDPKVRALSLQRLAILRSPKTVEYLKRYLNSEVEHPESTSDWLPVSEAQCAADTLGAILEGFPEGPLETQRTWMEGRTEYEFKPRETASILPVQSVHMLPGPD